MRPFTLSRMADLIRLVIAFDAVKPEAVEEAMMITRNRAVELLKQAEDMGFLRVEGYKYYSTGLGNSFREAFRNNDRLKIDNILSKYDPYFAVKEILTQQSSSMKQIKEETGLNEVTVEIILRLLRYIRDDFHSLGDRFFIEPEDMPSLGRFVTTVMKAYHEINNKAQWGQPRQFVRLDKVAGKTCGELRIPLSTFLRFLEKALATSSTIEVHSEAAGFQFIPFANRRIAPNSSRFYYMRVRK